MTQRHAQGLKYIYVLLAIILLGWTALVSGMVIASGAWFFTKEEPPEIYWLR